jgi:hypothetical protein
MRETAGCQPAASVISRTGMTAFGLGLDAAILARPVGGPRESGRALAGALGKVARAACPKGWPDVAFPTRRGQPLLILSPEPGACSV